MSSTPLATPRVQPRTAEHRWFLLFLVFVVILLSASYLAVFRRPPHGDEGHFLTTVRQFGDACNLNTLRHYEEMSTPLPFMVYAAWGHIVGFDTSRLRILSVLIALLTYVAFYFLLMQVFRDGRLAFFLGAFLALHPYMIGLSVFVYTDMLPILFVIVGLLSVVRRSPLGLGVASAGAILSRQYLVFFTAGLLLYYLLIYLSTRERHAVHMLLSLVISCLPLAALGLLWKGTSPDNAMKLQYSGDVFRFHPSALTLYVVQSFVYLVPVLLFRWRHFVRSVRTIVASFVLAWTYWLAPIAASPAAIRAQIDTVGYLHILIRRVTKGGRLGHVLFFVLFFLGLTVVLHFVKDAYGRLRRRESGLSLPLDLIMITFLVVMPFSYLTWEKYFLPLLPVLAIRIALLGREETANAAARAPTG